MKIFHINVPIFLTTVVCCHSCSREEAENAMYDFRGSRSRIQFQEGSYIEGGVRTYRGDVFVWIKDPEARFSAVFHELVHVIDTVLEIKGITNDEELRAYLMGWFKITLADKISKHIEKTQKKRKKHGSKRQ